MYFIPGDLPFWTRVGDAGNSCLNHQLRTIVELHPNLSARQLQIQTNKDSVFVKASIHIPRLKILISHQLPGTPIQHLAQISTWPPFLCSEWGPVALGSFSYSGWLWWSQTHRRKSSRNKSVKIKCRSHHGLHTHMLGYDSRCCFYVLIFSLLVFWLYCGKNPSAWNQWTLHTWHVFAWDVSASGVEIHIILHFIL